MNRHWEFFPVVWKAGSAMAELVELERLRRGIVSLTLSRPERRNALNIAMLRQLVERMELLEQEWDEGTGARVVLLRGSGAIFCSGMDLAEATQSELVAESASCIAAALRSLRYSPLVTIAVVQGGAYAGGAGLVAACDMAVGASDVQIGFPEARRGLLPALISQVLRNKVREGDLRELFLVGQPIGAQRAQQVGLLQRIAEPSRLLEESLQVADGILAGGPRTIVDTKRLLEHLYDAQLEGEERSDLAAIEEHLKGRSSPEAVEGLRAFLEKRPPSWMLGIEE
jgi:methylglutaconyl-CoA hydratase